MPAIRSLRRIPMFVWVPPIFSPLFKIEIETSDGTKYDVTDILISGEYTDGVTETIGSFSFTIDNSAQTYTTLFNPYDKINVYMDYATSATTLVFSGNLEKISKQSEKLKISGRSLAVQTFGITVTASFDNTATNVILKSILTTYAPFITQTNIDTEASTDFLTTVNWENKPFWEVVQELCNKSGYDAYIDQALDFHYFVSNTRENSTEVVLHESNLLETGEFSPDASVVRNRIIVYGAQIEEQQIIWMVEDTVSQATYKVKELIINDTNLTTPGQAEARGTYELSLSKDPPIIGEVRSLGLPTLKPGEQVRISDPLNGLDPQFYTITKFVHKFSNEEPMQTILTVQKEVSTLPKILKTRISFESQATTKINPNEMRFTLLFDFKEDVGIHNSTEITEGILKTDGAASGTWISTLLTTPSNLTNYELRVKGESLPGTTYFISTDGGVTYQDIAVLNTIYSALPPGLNILLKITFASANTQIDALSLLYKT